MNTSRTNRLEKSVHKKIVNMLDKDHEMFLAFGEDFIKATLTVAASQNHDVPELLASYLPVLLKLGFGHFE